jgi:hypothetical protein
MTTQQVSKSSRTKEPSVTDHQEIEWQFDAGDLELVESWLGQHDSGSSGFLIAPEFSSAVPDSKPYRTLTKGKKWKKFEKVLEWRKAVVIPAKSVR